MKKIFLIFLSWLITIIISIVYFHENPEKINKIKKYFKDDKNVVLGHQTGDILRSPGNSFIIEFSKEISFSEKTAFIVHDDNERNFDSNIVKIYFQNGSLYQNSELRKIILPSIFTTVKNGGIKSIFTYKGNDFALISSLKDKCFYASIVLLKNQEELFKTHCLPSDKIDFNGLGSSHIHLNDKILLTIGAPEQASSEIRILAQDKNSMFGKIVEISKNDLDKIIENEENSLELKIFTLGHRNPQGFTRVNEFFFSVEHGPKGGDELNKIIKGKNYGWPKVSYGTQYEYEDSGKAYEINHEENFFEEPIFAFVPSVGISALNSCPTKLKKYYNKPCLIALSLHGNSLRRGRSIIIYLLNEKMDKIHSIEKIHLRDDLKLRHFVTNFKNELYEDVEGNIFVSVDNKGIYKISFVYFRN